MRRFRFGRKKARKGIVGIEAAIVLIAFVLVAAALAFVVLNMGMFTAQKSKEVIARAYEESTRALEVSGSVIANVTGYNNPSQAKLTFVAIPIKLAAGARPVDLERTTVSVMVVKSDGKSVYFENAVTMVSTNPINENLSNFVDNLKIKTNTTITVNGSWAFSRSVGGTANKLLEPGEVGLLIVVFNESLNVNAYSRIVVEIKPPEGSVLTVERVVPPSLTSQYVNLDIG